VKSYLLRPGASFSTGVSKQEAELTAEMIATGSWKIKSFKTYNLDALGTPVPRGHLHPLMKVCPHLALLISPLVQFHFA